MRPILANQPQIENVSWYLLEALRLLVAAIQAGWNAQHNGDGRHTAVTADSLSVSGATALGKLRLTVATYTEPAGTGGTVNNLSCADLMGVSCLRIYAASSPLVITGIDATGRQQGDLLLVINADQTLSPKDLHLMAENTGSIAANRIAETTASPTTGGVPHIVNGAQGVWLMYDVQQQGLTAPPAARWRIIT